MACRRWHARHREARHSFHRQPGESRAADALRHGPVPPRFLVRCELAEQVVRFSPAVDLALRRRSKDQAADDLTNKEFGKSERSLQGAKQVDEIEWKVLSELRAEAALLSRETVRNRAAKKAAPLGPHVFEEVQAPPRLEGD